MSCLPLPCLFASPKAQGWRESGVCAEDGPDPPTHPSTTLSWMLAGQAPRGLIKSRGAALKQWDSTWSVFRDGKRKPFPGTKREGCEGPGLSSPGCATLDKARAALPGLKMAENR